MKIKSTTPNELDKINKRIKELRDQGVVVSMSFDTETTGFINRGPDGLNENRMLEFGGILMVDGKPLVDDNGKDISQIQIYFNPWKEDRSKNLVQSVHAYLVHGINQDFLEGKEPLGGDSDIYLEEPALTMDRYLDGLNELFNNTIIMSHNGVAFDMNFLRTEFEAAGHDGLKKGGIHLDTQRYFADGLKDITQRFPNLIEEINWKKSLKLSVDGEPNAGVVSFLEKLSGEKCPVDRFLHGALLDSKMLDWVVNKMSTVSYNGELLFPKFSKAHEIILHAVNKKKNVASINNENEDISKQEEQVPLYIIYSNRTVPYAENNMYQGSCELAKVFERAEKEGVKRLLVADYGMINQNREVEKLKKKYPEIEVNYGTTFRLKFGDKYALIDLVSLNDESHMELLSLLAKSTINDYKRPYLEIEDLKGKSMAKLLKYQFYEDASGQKMVDNASPISVEDLREIYKIGGVFEVSNDKQVENYAKLGIPLKRLCPVLNAHFTDKETHGLRILSQKGEKGVLLSDIKYENVSGFLSLKDANKRFENYGGEILQLKSLPHDFVLPKSRNIMEDYFVGDGYENTLQEFIERSNNGLKEILRNKNITSPDLIKVYEDRLKHEQDVIISMLNKSIKDKEEGKTEDVIKFDEYLLAMSEKIRAVKNISSIIRNETDSPYSMQVGPGRGSAAGSLLAYALKITNIDPIKSGLLFERFINPERVSMPDIDTDFSGEIDIEQLNIDSINKEYPYLYEFMKEASKRRHDSSSVLDVKVFVTEYYGWYRASRGGKKKPDFDELGVGGIMTFGEYKAKSALSSVCKIFGDEVANLMGFKGYVELSDFLKGFVGNSPIEANMSLNTIIEGNEAFKDLIERNPIINEIVEYSKKLEGGIKSLGIHAGAVVSAPIENKGACNTVIFVGQGGLPVATGYEFTKNDILGLKTLQTIAEATSHIKDTLNLNEEEFNQVYDKVNDYMDIPDETDPVIIKEMIRILKEGETHGLFQIESDGMKALFQKVFSEKKDFNSFEDIFKTISVLIALYRPGPMDSGMLDKFVENITKDEAVKAPFGNKDLEELLKETSGVIAYQEQVMKIVQIIGGFSLGEADVIRRAMGKKDADAMKEYKTKFVEGGKKNGYPEKELEELFEDIEKFAGYGFNKSHSAAYANITMQTLYLKSRFKIQFATAILDNKIDKKASDFKIVLDNIVEEGHKINPPNIFDIDNFSVKFSIKKDGEDESINFGYQFIVGENSAKKLEKIIEVAKGGSFSDEDIRNMIFKELDKGAVEKLIKAGDLRIGNETLAEVSEKLLAAKDKKGKTQYDIVKDFLMKDKVSFAKGFDNAIKRQSSKWNKDTFVSLLDDKDIREHLTKIGKWEDFQRVMLGSEKNGEKIPGKIETQSYFPYTEYDLWKEEIKTICMENKTKHPLSGEGIRKIEKKKGIQHLNDILEEFKKLETSEQKEKLAKRLNNIEVIGIVKSIRGIISKSGNPMLIGDLETEGNGTLTLMVTGASIEDIKIGENIREGEVVAVTGKVLFNEDRGLAFMATESEIIPPTGLVSSNKNVNLNKKSWNITINAKDGGKDFVFSYLKDVNGDNVALLGPEGKYGIVISRDDLLLSNDKVHGQVFELFEDGSIKLVDGKFYELKVGEEAINTTIKKSIINKTKTRGMTPPPVPPMARR